jgi:hypothetical protein
MHIPAKYLRVFDWLAEQKAINAAHRAAANRKPTRYSDEKPFDWRTTCQRATFASIAGRFNRADRHGPQTWTGEFPDAPPTGQGPCAPSVWSEPDTSYIVTHPREWQGGIYHPRPFLMRAPAHAEKPTRQPVRRAA